MYHVILHIPRISTILLNDIFRKEEEKYCKIDRKFYFIICIKDFFKKNKRITNNIKRISKF